MVGLLTNVLLGISTDPKIASKGSHQTVSVPMSQTSIPCGRVTAKSMLL